MVVVATLVASLHHLGRGLGSMTDHWLQVTFTSSTNYHIFVGSDSEHSLYMI